MRRAIVIALVLAGCGGSSPPVERAARTCAPTEGHAETVEPAPAGTPSRVKLGPGMELKATKRNLAAAAIGKPLVVTGVVTGTNCRPLAGATVYAWQTNGNGRYGPTRNGQDRCCYLTGAMRTGEDGRYSFISVMPKGYDGGRAHIHFQFGHPDAEGVITELVLDAPVAEVDYDVVLRDR
jgi:protocatechuate 3,4-dioxygenase beta subunit